jgi:hypothetical protein
VKRAIILGKAAARGLEKRLSYLRDARPGAEERLASEMTRLLNLVSEFPNLHAPFGRTLRRAVLEDMVSWGFLSVECSLRLRRGHPRSASRSGCHPAPAWAT